MGSTLYGFGDLSGHHIAEAWRGFIESARALRKRLGSSAYLADRYIGFMLECTVNRYGERVPSEGFDAGGDLYWLCMNIIDGDDKRNEHPLHDLAAKYISAHPLPELHRTTRVWVYCAALFEPYAGYALKKYVYELEAESREVVDLETLDALQDQIIAALEGDADALFENMITQYKICCSLTSVTAMYLGSMVYEIMEALCDCDKITGRKGFQVLLDEQLDKT